jgi:DnaJ-class molecular chaperone
VSDAANTDLSAAAALLGVSLSATAEELRSAYLRQLQQNPPDREPELFEKIRDAYAQLRDPNVRAAAVMRGPSPAAPLTQFMDGLKTKRNFVGSPLWLQLLKEKRS